MNLLIMNFAIVVILLVCIVGFGVYNIWDDNNCKNNPLYPTAQDYKNCVGNNWGAKIFMLVIPLFGFALIFTVFGGFKNTKTHSPRRDA